MFKSLFSRKQKPPQFNESWGVYRRENGDDMTYVRIDFGVANLVPVDSFDTIVTFELEQDLSEGWDQINALEDRVAEITAKYLGIPVVSHRFGDQLDCYVYFCKKNFGSDMRSELEKALPPRVKMTIEDDPKWVVYSKFQPNSQEDRIMQNMRVENVLRSHGDQLAEPRHVIHFAIFDDASDLLAYTEFVKDLGYGLYGERDDQTCAFDGQELPSSDEFNQRTIELMEKAQALNGRYDGWECAVVSA